MASPALRKVASFYLYAASLALALAPLAGIVYLQTYQTEAPRYVEHSFHIWSIGAVVLVSAVLSFIAWRCYLEGGERLTRYLTLGYLGFTVTYALHGILTPLADSMPALFLLPGPSARLVMTVCLLGGVMGYGLPAEALQLRRSPSLWLPGMMTLGLFLLAVLWLAADQPLPFQTLRLGTEAAAGILSLGVLLLLPLKRVKGPMLWYHAIALTWMAESSLGFIYAGVWNQMWWFSHIVSLSGFVLLGCGLAQAFLTSGSFSGLYSASKAYADLAEIKHAHEMLQMAITRANQANQAKSRFLASASHDLRQPVQSLMLFVTLLETFGLEERPRTVVHNLSSAVQALKGLLDGLLDISRLDAGIIEPNPTDFELRTLLSSLSEEYSLTTARKNLTLAVASPELWLRTDPALLERILRNLLDNAIKYTDRGGIAINCRAEDGRARIELRDSGIGIPEDQHEQVFDEFHQLNNPERDRSKGLGLGLAIVKRLTGLLGITLEMSSKPGKGTCFVLWLPLGRAPAAQAEIEPLRAAKAGLALVIEDDEAVLEGLVMLLEHWGWRVASGTDAEQVLDRLTPGDRPDLAISDYRLRGNTTGIQALDKLHKALGQDFPAILLTGDTAPERMTEALQSGLLMLHKPVTSEGLQRALRIVMAPESAQP